MNQLPGTNLKASSLDVRHLFKSLFVAGDLLLSQVCNITELETHNVQNWVKRKFISSPQNKKYSIDQVCKIITINFLKETLSIETICSFTNYINIEHNDKIFISDSDLYFYFIDLIHFKEKNSKAIDESLDFICIKLEAQHHATSTKLKKILKIMYTAYLSCEYKKEALLLCKASEIT